MPRTDQQIPFIGPSYVSRSVSVDAQRSINLYPEIVESRQGKNTYALFGTPGRKVFLTLPAFPLRGMLVSINRLFVAAGNKLYEVYSNGTYSERGTLYTSAGYVGMEDNGTQLCIVDGRHQYILTFDTNAFQADPAGVGFLGSRTVTFLDGYFIFSQPETNTFFISGLYNGTSIDPLDIARKSGHSDDISTTIALHKQLYVLGVQTSEIWYDSGDADFPFTPVQGAFIETGCVAPFSVAKMDNTAYFVASDTQGSGVVYRFNGFTPERVSTHAIEHILLGMGDLGALIGYTYQEEGHTFYVINSPNAGTTIVYDSTTQAWHERQSYDPITGQLTRDRASFYAFAFNKRLMGDWQNGVIYESSLDFYDDAGTPIHAIRTAPHISDNLKRTFYDFFQVDCETGVGLDGSGQGTDPQMMMQYSNDGGYVYSPERWKSIGKIGERKARAYWNKLGSGRDRVFRVKITDPVKRVLIDAKIGAKPGRY